MAVESFEGLCQKAREAVEQRSPDRARQLYLQALGLKSDSPDVHYGLATVCFQLKDLPSAAYHFKEVTRLDPLRAGAYINLGAVYNLLDQLDEAIPALRRAIQLDSHRAEGYYNLALVYRRKGQVELAIQAYREALRINPRMPDAHYNLANLYLEKGKYAAAISHYQQALELRPNWDKAVNGLAQAEAALAAEEPVRAGVNVPETGPGPDVIAASGAKAAPATTAHALDPERTIDPMVHGTLLTSLHKATIDSDNQGRQFLEILEKEIEPAIKELSSCLLYPDTSLNELDQCVHKFEAAMASMRSAHKNLQGSFDKIRNLGDRLLET
jgi:thioredoxin-like negative regulator of GroEL/exonuclease VII small subunit